MKRYLKVTIDASCKRAAIGGGVVPVLALVIPFRVMAICARILSLPLSGVVPNLPQLAATMANGP